MIDGSLLPVTNTPSVSLAPAEVVARYKSLADIERGFKVFKSELEKGRAITDCSSEFGRMPRFASWR